MTVKNCSTCRGRDALVGRGSCTTACFLSDEYPDWSPKVGIGHNGGPPLDEPETPEVREEPIDEPVKSDGGSSTYYFLPKNATELNDIIEFKKMSFARGNAFKALYRLGNKEGTDVEYDLKKIEFFVERMRQMLAKGIPL